MKKILIFGNAESVFIQDFILQYSNRDYLVDLVSYGNSSKVVGTRNHYSYKSTSKQKINKHFEVYQSLSKVLDKIEDSYDSVIIHYVNFYYAMHILRIKKLSPNLVVVVWGSDFYRVNSKLTILLQNIIYKMADKIIFTSPTTRNHFLNQKGFISRNSTKVVRFGLPVLDEIDKLLEMPEYEKWCSEFNIPHDKIKISIGYNADLAQKQLQAIEQISKLDKNITCSIHLIFPLGYGHKESTEKIKSKLFETGISNFTILEKFYNHHDVAKLRIVTDILVNIQPSDQFSGSMQEVLYAGNSVIAGKWLPYDDIIDNGAPIYSIETLDNLGECLTTIINKGSVAKTNQIKSYISSLSSWEANIAIWDKVLFGSSASIENSNGL